MIKIEVDFETEVIDYLSEKGHVRRGQLIKYLIESHPGDRGYSKKSIERKLANMHKAELILILKDLQDLEKHGIEKEDGKASYVFAKNSIERTRHIDTIFNLLKTGDEIDKKMVLDEIKRYEKRYVLNPSQLDLLVLNLDNKDTCLIDNLLEILYKHIIDKGIKPGNKTILLEKLRDLLERYPEEHKKHTMLRRRVIWLLGFYNDKAIIEQLKKDVEAGILSRQKGDYWNWSTVRVIEEGRTELFYLENRLRKEGNIETADALAEIRNQAEILSEKPIDPNEPREAAISSLGQIPNLRGIKK
ncbi:hypothetical protein FXV91_17195 [Methanosarcina sp. DH2]|uniref:hypothetical protein n=1 Tax=Methanosarcina sp. DH2 TaxID=2605639 RepID=UPI001E465155|nr:hypothetical protein [Methanosarcina sp. DH2]MCC4771836.1 hypothetical protein [Methanosarcina sp. DH2]